MNLEEQLNKLLAYMNRFYYKYNIRTTHTINYKILKVTRKVTYNDT